MYIPVYHYPYQIYIPDKGASVVSLATTTAAIFVNADDHLSNWEENSSQYNYIQQVLGRQRTPIINHTNDHEEDIFMLKVRFGNANYNWINKISIKSIWCYIKQSIYSSTSGSLS